MLLALASLFCGFHEHSSRQPSCSAGVFHVELYLQEPGRLLCDWGMLARRVTCGVGLCRKVFKWTGIVAYPITRGFWITPMP